MSYNKLIPLMKKKGSDLTPLQFQERVNIIFHDHEAALYDKMHADMKNSLQEQVDLLVADIYNHSGFVQEKLQVLDVGCGTGLSTEFLLKSKMGPFIEKVTLLDSSPRMLELAGEKAKNWETNFSLMNSTIQNTPGQFDVVLVSSVLHHIPDLKDFLVEIDRVLKVNGLLIHLQDPNGDYLNDKHLLKRMDLLKQRKEDNSKKKIKDVIPKPVKTYINRMLGRKTYIDLTNEQLIKEKVIKRPMTADEIWSVTDIHVETNGNTETKGISFYFLKKRLKNFSLISHRSYAFFGKLKSDLDEDLKLMEEEFIYKKELNGRNISCVWMKK